MSGNFSVCSRKRLLNRLKRAFKILRRRAREGHTISDMTSRKLNVVLLAVLFRSGIARCAEAYDIVPGTHIHLSREGNNALYIILSGSVKAEVNHIVDQQRVSTGRDPGGAASMPILLRRCSVLREHKPNYICRLVVNCPLYRNEPGLKTKGPRHPGFLGANR